VTLAEEREILAPEDHVDRMLNEVLSCEPPSLITSWEKFERDVPSRLEDQDIIIYYGFSAVLLRDVLVPWNTRLSQRGIPPYFITETIDTFPPGSIEEVHTATRDRIQEEQENIEKLREENSTLNKKVLSLQNEILSFYHMVQFAAAVVFLLCAMSIPIWIVFDIRLLSPFLSIAGIIGAPFFVAMARLGKKEFIQKKTSEGNQDVPNAQVASQQ
jgi:hypothetical protein